MPFLLATDVALGARCRRFESCLPDSNKTQSQTGIQAVLPRRLFCFLPSDVPSRCRESGNLCREPSKSRRDIGGDKAIWMDRVGEQSGNRPIERYAHRGWWSPIFQLFGSSSPLIGKVRRPFTACVHRTERITINHPTAQRSWWDSFDLLMKDQTPIWACCKDACAHLGLGSTALRQLQWDGVLTPGKHWIYANGVKSGPVRFNVPAIREWQAERTVELFNSRPETYEENK